ncbi:MAG: hypothetical protein ACNA8W_26365, partial [Bradymonadaceae bacterium]
GVDPIGLDNNVALDARRFDWFRDNNVPLRRDYQWQLVDADFSAEEVCADPGSSWQRMENRLTVPYAWVEAPRCMAARPIRADRDGALVKVPFDPSAELIAERQDYVPSEIRHPTIYGILYDMQIRNAGRCAQIMRTLEDTIDAAMKERPGDLVKVGSYTPVSPQTGEPLDGCGQVAMQDYPITQMVEDVKEAAGDFADENIRVIWIYVNNIELPPSERLLMQLIDLGVRHAFGEHDLHVYTWTIGSNVIMNIAPWHWTTGWRPIEDETFVADLESFPGYNVPFRTMKHTETTEVRIRPLEQATDPLLFKVCQSTLPMTMIRTGDRPFLRPRDVVFTWPDDDRVAYRIDLSPQDMVPFQEYRRQINSVVIEVCERFCSNPFRSRAGQDFLDWRA